MSDQPPPPPPPPPYGSASYSSGPGGLPASSGSAVTALVLGIVGLVMCGPFTAVPAIVVGRNAMREIDASQGRIGGRGMAQAGYVLGIIGTVLGALVLLLFLGLFAIGGMVSGGSSPSCDVRADGSSSHSCD